MKRVLTAIAILASLYALGQSESITVFRDKEVAYRGDTLWLCAYIFGDGATTSSNLHVELMAENKEKLQDYIFRCKDGFSGGQIPCPDLPGNYWISVYTLSSQCNVFSLTVRPKGSDYIRKRPAPDTSCPDLMGGLLRIGHDSGGYFIQRANALLQFYSAVVSDTNQPFHFRNSYTFPGGAYLADTNNLSFEWKAKGKESLSGRDLVMVYEQGKQQQFLNFTIDSTQSVRLSNLSFFDSGAYIHYQLNHIADPIELLPVTVSRSFKLPDSCIIDTVKEKYVELSGEKSAKTLDTVQVHASWQNRNKWLHKKYISGNPWNIALEMGYTNWNYDLDKDTVSKWVRQTVGGYLWDQMKPHPAVHYVIGFVDGVRTPWEYAMNVDISLVKYIEFVEGVYDGQLECVYCTIWTRKGEDARKIPGGMKELRLRGYTEMMKWTTSDRYTKNWIPFSAAQKTYITPKAPFNIEILAFVKGRPYYLGMTIE